eukprot:gene633-8136_t
MSSNDELERNKEFKKYLEKQGIVDIYTKALTALYEQEEKPKDGIEFIRKFFGENTEAYKLLKIENEKLKKEIEELKNQK